MVVRNIDPVLSALVLLLPEEGEPFPLEKQERWIETMRAAFYLIYREEGEAEQALKEAGRDA